MDFEKVKKALLECDEVLVRLHPHAQPEKNHQSGELILQVGHLRYMVREVLTWEPERLEKAFRWLGFIQGAMWGLGFARIDLLKKMNMPEEVKSK